MAAIKKTGAIELTKYHGVIGPRHSERVGNQEFEFFLASNGGRFPGLVTDVEYAPVQRAIQRVGAVESRLLGLQSGGRLTPQGISEEMRKELEVHLKASLNDRRAIEQELAKEGVRAAEIATSAVPKLDRADAVGALLDRELRDYWRGLDFEEKSALHAQMMEGKHSDLATALLRGPESVVGLISSRREQLLDAVTPQASRDSLGKSSDRTKRLEASLHALNVSERVMGLHAGVVPSEARAMTGEPFRAAPKA